MPNPEHIFIQPWFHADESWAGFNVAFSGPRENLPEALTDLHSSGALEALDHRLPWFIPVPSLACAAAASEIPARQIVLLLQPDLDQEGPESWAPLAAELRRDHLRVGLIVESSDALPDTAEWSHVVLAASHARTLPTSLLNGLAARSTLAITGLHSRSDVAWALANHCSLVTGEYLLNRVPPCHKPDMLRMRLLKLLALIAEDAATHDIEEVFRQEPKLAYGLLRLVNSASMGHRGPIASFAQAITLLGRQQLQRWLQLLVYADPDNGQRPNPLLLQAATRGCLMENLAIAMPFSLQADFHPDVAFMIGSFSLLDVLLNLSMPEILQQLPLPDGARAALEEHRGPVGTLLTALSAAENHDFEGASRLLAELGIDIKTFTTAQLSAFAWASKIRPAA